MWQIDYYIEPNGHIPVYEWLNSLEKNISAHMYDKAVRLQQNGLTLLNTNMMKPIKGHGNDFYVSLSNGDDPVYAHFDTFYSTLGFDYSTYIYLH